jgi:hypothetical protein
MTHEERVQAVIDVGFTERQSRFLVLVLRHAGVCVPRQYASFAGVTNGARRCNAFFAKLLRRGYATQNDCVHNRARLYHLRHKRLYSIIGEITSRHRRRVSPRLAVERLMLLDGVLMTPHLEWLTTATEKAGYLTKLQGDTASDLPTQQPAGGPPERRPEVSSTFPIGLEADGRAVLLYLAAEPWPDGFRSFLQGHVPLFRLARTWTVRLVFPHPVHRAYDAYQEVIRDELESPLHPATIRELKWYFEHRLKATREAMHPETQGLLGVGATVFGTPRFADMYHRWLRQGDTVFEGPCSPAMAEALNTGRGRVESVVLTHSYRHLFPLVDQAVAPPQQIDTGLRRAPRGGTRRRHVLNPRSQPPAGAETEPDIGEQMARDWHRLNDYYNARKAVQVTP